MSTNIWLLRVISDDILHIYNTWDYYIYKTRQDVMCNLYNIPGIIRASATDKFDLFIFGRKIRHKNPPTLS